MTAASTPASIQSVPQMGRPSETPRYWSRLPWKSASASCDPVASWKSLAISPTLPTPCVVAYTPIDGSPSASETPAGDPAAFSATAEELSAV